MDRKLFFSFIRKNLFAGRLTPKQVSGTERLLDAWTHYGTGDRRHLAYILATDFHETGKKMQPVHEIGRGKGHKYGQKHPTTGHVYYGRGDVQLTWFDNYQKMGELLGVDLVNKPDLALDPAVSARILIEGVTRGVSIKGDFTGKALEDYIHGSKADYVGARRTVNGTDRADLIAGYAIKFEHALREAGMPLNSGKAVPLAALDPTELETEIARKLSHDQKQLMERIQTDLKGFDYHEIGDIDGKYGPRTRAAVLAFRADRNLPIVENQLLGDDLLPALAAAKVAGFKRPQMSDRIVKPAAEIAKTSSTMKTSWWGRLGIGGGIGGGAVGTVIKESLAPDLIEERLSLTQRLFLFASDNWPLLLGMLGAGVAAWAAFLIVDRLRVKAEREGRHFST